MGATIQCVNADGDSALHLACANGSSEAVARLIALGASLNQRAGNTPLGVAAAYGRTDTARLLLDAGADVNATNEWGATALLLAVRSGNFETAALLLRRGADPTPSDYKGDTALGWAIKRPRPGSEAIAKAIRTALARQRLGAETP